MCIKLAINMPGSVSAGAYTAGVLDFLTEALDAWYVAKRNGELVPAHDVSIEASTGASAGGMCAAISAVLLQDNFEHITDTSRVETTNRFYESWVNRIDLSELLKTNDLSASSQSVTSLFASSIIESIAAYAIRRVDPLTEPRPYVSPRLTLFLSLTNLGGVPYSADGATRNPAAHTSMFHGDRIRFETKRAVDQVPMSPVAHPIDLSDQVEDSSWQTLRAAAMATGAFPALLAPRTLQRFRAEYQEPIWESVKPAAQARPSAGQSTLPVGTPDQFDTLNVDGGVTNNDPFSYARDFLYSLHPVLPDTSLSQAPCEVDRAIITIAPASTMERSSTAFCIAADPSIIQTLLRLLKVLISQSRFSGETSNQLVAGKTFNSFIISPSDKEVPLQDHSEATPASALQCASLGAFGGFFERGFRAHDFALGRRNCQKFLRDHFVLPISNPLIAAGLPDDPAARAEMLLRYGRPAPAGEADGQWLPMIPLCGPVASHAIAEVPRFRMTQQKLDVSVELILRRFRAVSAALLPLIPSFSLRMFLRMGQPVIAILTKRPLRTLLSRHLCSSIQRSAD